MVFFKLRGAISAVLLMMTTLVPLWAEVRVEIEPPELQDGMAELEATVGAEINAAAGELADFVNAILEKPGLLRACVDAHAAADSLRPGRSSGTEGEYSLDIGSSVGIASESFNPETMEKRIEALEETDDIYAGAGIRPLVCFFSFPADKLIPELRFTTGIGYLTVSKDEYELTGYGLLASAGYPVLPARRAGTFVEFGGIDLTIGASLLHNRVTAPFSPGTITESFTVDPDGDGPFLPQSVAVQVEPEITAVFETGVYSLSAGLSTGIKLVDFLTLTVGATGELVTGSSQLELSSNDEVVLLGYLSGLVAENSRLIVSGGTDDVSPSPLEISLFSGLTWRVGTYRSSALISWRSNRGLAAGIFFGVSL